MYQVFDKDDPIEVRKEKKFAWIDYKIRFEPDKFISWTRGFLFGRRIKEESQKLVDLLLSTKPKNWDELEQTCASVGLTYLRERDMTFWRYDGEEKDLADDECRRALQRQLDYLFTKRRTSRPSLCHQVRLFIPTATDEEVDAFIEAEPKTVDDLHRVVDELGFTHWTTQRRKYQRFLKFRSAQEEQEYLEEKKARIGSVENPRETIFEKSQEWDLSNEGKYDSLLFCFLCRPTQQERDDIIAYVIEHGTPSNYEEFKKVVGKFGFTYSFADGEGMLYRSELEWVAMQIDQTIGPRESLRCGFGFYTNWPYERRLAYSRLPKVRAVDGAFDKSDTALVLEHLYEIKESKACWNHKFYEACEANGLIAAMEAGIGIRDLIAPFVPDKERIWR